MPVTFTTTSRFYGCQRCQKRPSAKLCGVCGDEFCLTCAIKHILQEHMEDVEQKELTPRPDDPSNKSPPWTKKKKNQNINENEWFY